MNHGLYENFVLFDYVFEICSGIRQRTYPLANSRDLGAALFCVFRRATPVRVQIANIRTLHRKFINWTQKREPIKPLIVIIEKS